MISGKSDCRLFNIGYVNIIDGITIIRKLISVKLGETLHLVEKNWKNNLTLSLMVLVLNDENVKTILFKDSNDIIIIVTGLLVNLNEGNIDTLLSENHNNIMILLSRTELDFQHWNALLYGNNENKKIALNAIIFNLNEESKWVTLPIEQNNVTVIVSDILLNLQDKNTHLSNLLAEKNSVMFYIWLPNATINLNPESVSIVLVSDETDIRNGVRFKLKPGVEEKIGFLESLEGWRWR